MTEGNGALTKEQILGAEDRKVVPIECPEWGGRVYVRPLSGEQRDELEERYGNAESVIGIRAWIAASGMCDGKGESLDWSAREVDMLGQKSAASLDRVASRIQEISGISNKDVEELEKNSGTVQSDGSGSDSVSPTVS